MNRDVAVRAADQPPSVAAEPNRDLAVELVRDARQLGTDETAIAIGAAVSESVGHVIEAAIPYGTHVSAEIDFTHEASNGSRTHVQVKVRSQGR